MSEKRQELRALGLAVCVEALAEHAFHARIVSARMKLEFEAAFALLRRTEAGEHARHLANIGLGIAAVDAESVKLEELARVVFVEPAFLTLALGRHESAFRNAARVVQVNQHGRMMRGGAEQRVEATERVRANRLFHVVPGEKLDEPFARKHV